MDTKHFDLTFFTQGKLEEPYPTHKLKRVAHPTIRIPGPVQRVDERESGFNRAHRGDFGPVPKRERPRFVMKYPLSGALGSMQFHLVNVVDGPVAETKAPIPEDPAVLSRHIKEVAYFLRADLVGICELPPYAVYTHTFKDNAPVGLSHKYAIGILIDQNYRASSGGTGHDWISNSMSFMSYSASGFIACILADYIRRLGYPARAHHARDYQVVLPPILLWAGLGEMCRIGDIVLNPFLGPRFKAAVVTTDLPLLPDQPIDFGLQKFCEICGKCARECPSGAITKGGKSIYNGYEIWKTDVEKCTKFRTSNPNGAGCGTCIKVCPWSKPNTWYHKLATGAAQKSHLARRLLVWMDDLMGYGKQDLKKKWWFDMVEQDGKIVRPKQAKYDL